MTQTSRSIPEGRSEAMRALLYARYSTMLQKEASIEDQLRICSQHAGREGWTVVEAFPDYAISGAVRARPGLNALLEAVSAGRGDVVLAESIDRLSRDQEDIARIFKQVSFAGARIVTLQEGEINELHVGMKGTMAALYRKDLAEKTRRGQTGRVLAGRCPGGNAYGYRRVARFDANGEPERGLREIDEAEAAIVRRIFSEFIDGRSPRDIAKRLNAEGVPGPTGGPWSASTINGDRVRKNGILQNELYIGQIVFNKTRRSIDPETRKKRIRPMPPDTWTSVPAPQLRIIDDASWNAVSQRRRRFDGVRTEQQRRPKRLLSGLVRCGVCGGSYTVIGAEKWGCATKRQRGSCSNGRTIQTHVLERRVLAGLTDELLAPELVSEFVREFHRRRAERSRSGAAEEAKAGKRVAAARGKVERLVRAVTDGGAEFSEIRDALAKARQELAQAETAVSEAATSPVIALHPGLADEYRRRVADLPELLASGDEDKKRAAGERIRELIENVILSPNSAGAGVSIEIEGRLAAALTLAVGGTALPDVCLQWCPGEDSNLHALASAST
jgi:site-specific DNA recombinase